MSKIRFKTFSGSFSRYWNKNLKYVFLQNIFCQKMFNNEISTHKLCPKSGLKHSVVHSQGIGIKNVNIFFQNIFCQKMFKNEISTHNP